MRWPLVLALALTMAGCGTNDDRNQARQVVERFYDAVRHDRGDEACDLITPGLADAIESQTEQSCEGVITRLDYEGGGVEDVQVFITTAKVDLNRGESAFLDRGVAGWRLTAIGCIAEGDEPLDKPMDCQAES
jgi:hypothetical protein